MEKHMNIPKLRFPEFKDEWKKKKLGELTTKTDKKNKSKELLPVYSISNKFGFIPQATQFEGMDSIERGYDTTLYKIIENNTFAYNPARINVGSIGYNENLGRLIVSSLYVCFQTTEDVYDNFLNHFFDTTKFNNYVLSNGEGGVRIYLFYENFSLIPFFIPTILEQKRISSFFTVFDKKIAELKQKKNLLEQYKKGVMQKLISQKLRFKDENGNDFPKWEKKPLGELLDYIQPTKYLVESTDYDDSYETPVLTAGKSFILGYTNETFGIYNDQLPLIIFDDFTTAMQFVDFPFKAKSSAMKLLVPKKQSNIYFIFEAMQTIGYAIGGHERHWISKYAKIEIPVPSPEEQNRISNFINSINRKLEHTEKQLQQTQQFKKGLLQNMFI